MKQLTIVFGLLCVLITVSCNHTENHEVEESKYLVTTPLTKDTLIYKEYVCQIHAINHIEIRSQERGYLQSIFVDEGQFIKKGQLMFQIMPTLYQAEKEKAAANVSFAEIEYQNTKNLADSHIVSKNELALAKAKLDKEKAELSLANAHLAFTQIKAPFDGIMDKFYERKGSLIDEGALLTMLSDNSKMWVYFNVPEAEYLNFITDTKKSDKKTVKLMMANNAMYPLNGVVETIEADFNNETGNIAFRATFENPKRILRHGETGNILMPVEVKNALLIPQKATFEILDKKYVFVVDKDNIVKTRHITVGLEMPHLFAVTSGLLPTDRILIEGIRKVKNNDKIEVENVDNKKVFSELDELHAE